MSDIKYAYYESAVGYKVTGKDNDSVLLAGGGSKPLSTFVDTDTTYTAGTGIRLTGTVFSQDLTISGTGNYISNIAQDTNGFTVTKSSLPIPALVTSTTATGITNVATTNANTFLNVVFNGVATGTSTQVTGAGSVTVASDTSGKLTITGAAIPTTLPPNGAAGGALTGTYPNPTLNATITADIAKGVTAHGWGNHSGLYIPVGQRGAVNGVASLDASGLVPSSQLPSYVDDIIEAANMTALNALPAAEKMAGKIYITLDNNKTYRWGGTAFVEVSSGAIGLATSSTPGIVELFSDTVQSVAASAVSATAARTYGVQVNAAGQMVVNVPWVDTNTDTTYAGSTSITLSGNSFQRAALTGDVTASANSNATTIANDVVSNAKLSNMAANTIKGAVSAGDPVDLTVAQVKTMLDIQTITATHTGASTKNIVHNWNTRRINVVITDSVTFYQIDARVRMTTLNAIDIEFDSAPPNAIDITLTKMA